MNFIIKTHNPYITEIPPDNSMSDNIGMPFTILYHNLIYCSKYMLFLIHVVFHSKTP